MPFAKSTSTRFGKQTGDLARKMGGHGGMDYVMNYRLMDCLKRGLVPDINVYDAAAWSAPTPLSEASVAQNGAPQKFPDFTRGKWNAHTDSPALPFRLKRRASILAELS